MSLFSIVVLLCEGGMALVFCHFPHRFVGNVVDGNIFREKIFPDGKPTFRTAGQEHEIFEEADRAEQVLADCCETVNDHFVTEPTQQVTRHDF